jgi:hypothetical protein
MYIHSGPLSLLSIIFLRSVDYFDCCVLARAYSLSNEAKEGMDESNDGMLTI